MPPPYHLRPCILTKLLTWPLISLLTAQYARDLHSNWASYYNVLGWRMYILVPLVWLTAVVMIYGIVGVLTRPLGEGREQLFDAETGLLFDVEEEMKGMKREESLGKSAGDVGKGGFFMSRNGTVERVKDAGWVDPCCLSPQGQEGALSERAMYLA